MVTSATSRLPQLLMTVVSPEGDVLNRVEVRPRANVLIGRSAECDVVLRDFGTKISRRHAVLMTEKGHWEFFNLGVNGSFENGLRVDHLDLSDGCSVRLSRHGPLLQFRFNKSGLKTENREDSDITEWMSRLKSGDEDAALQLWNRYSEQIADVARRTLKQSSSRVTDEEDIVVIAFKSFLAGIRSGRFPQLDHREQLWRLMMVITTRKAAAALAKDRRQKRGSGHVRGDSAMMRAVDMPQIHAGFNDSNILKSREDSDLLQGFDRLQSVSTTPDIAALMADEAQELLRLLPDEVSRQVACLKLDGHTHEEIADKLQCNVRTVERRLKQIRDLWAKRLGIEE